MRGNVTALIPVHGAGAWLDPRSIGYASLDNPPSSKHPPHSKPCKDKNHKCQGPSSTHHTSVVLKVEVDTVGPSPGLALTDNNSGHDLLTKLRLSLLDGGHDHVTNTRSGETVETGTKTRDRDDVQVASSGVVAAVQHGAAVKHIRKPLAQNNPYLHVNSMYPSLA